MEAKKKTWKRCLAAVRERAVRLVREALKSHGSEWAAIQSIALKIGCTGETLRGWLRQAERDAGRRDGMTTEERARMKVLEREVRELKQANEFLRKASAYFAQAEFDRRSKIGSRSSTITGVMSASSRSTGPRIARIAAEEGMEDHARKLRPDRERQKDHGGGRRRRGEPAPPCGRNHLRRRNAARLFARSPIRFGHSPHSVLRLSVFVLKCGA